MPGIVPGTEWAAYYDELAAEFGLTIDAVGPNFGTEHAAGRDRRLPGAGHLRRRADPAALAGPLRPAPHPVRDPTPVYPHSLIWRGDNPHPGLAALRGYVRSVPPRAARHRHLGPVMGPSSGPREPADGEPGPQVAQRLADVHGGEPRDLAAIFQFVRQVGHRPVAQGPQRLLVMGREARADPGYQRGEGAELIAARPDPGRLYPAGPSRAKSLPKSWHPSQ